MRRTSADSPRGIARLLALLLGLILVAPAAFAQDEEEGDEEGEGDGDPDIKRSDEDDVDDWSFEGEKVKEEKVKEEKKETRQLEPEPARNGSSGNWYEVTVDCATCENLLGQHLGIEEQQVMREYFDYIQIESNRKAGKFVFTSISENRPLGVSEKGKRVLIWKYVIDTGTRLTDTYATIWDMQTKADGGLLYGRKYEVQAWTADAYEDWERGYKSKQSFIPVSKLNTYANLAPVKALTVEEPRFQVGENARISFVGYSAFVRSDVSQEAIEREQQELKAAAEAEAKRIRDQKEYFEKGERQLDDRDYEGAKTSFSQARALGMESLDLAYNLGYAFYKVGDYDAAKAEYRTILDADPRDTEVRYNLARIHEKEKNFDEAIKEYQAILKFNPDDSSARDRLELLKAAREMIGG